MADEEADEEVLEIIPLEGWMTFYEAAALLKCSKQHVHTLVWETGEFDYTKDLRALTFRADQTVYLLRETAVKALAANREAHPHPQQLRWVKARAAKKK